MIQVIQANYIKQYKIYVTFNDHLAGMLDLKDIITQDHRTIFKELVNIEQFKQFKVAADTIIWENGLDLAPEFLYKLISAEKA